MNLFSNYKAFAAREEVEVKLKKEAVKEAEPVKNVESTRTVSAETYQGFIRTFLAYVKSLKLYPKGHSRLTNQLEQFYDITGEIISLEQELSIFIRPDSIWLNGHEFTADDFMVLELAPELVKRLIRYIVITKGVEPEELDMLAGLLLQDPDELKEKGGSDALLSGKDTNHLRILEFSYNMESYVKSADDLKIVKSLAEFENAKSPEMHIINRMQELEIKPGEYNRLGKLLEQPFISDKLSTMQHLLEQELTEAADKLHTSDLLLYLVRSISRAEKDLKNVNEEDISSIVSCILDRICDQLLSPLKITTGQTKNKVLNKIASRMLDSPEAFLAWADPTTEGPIAGLKTDQAELLKILFNRPNKGSMAFQLGNKQLEKFRKPKLSKGPGINLHSIPTAVDLDKFSTLLNETRESIQEQQLEYDAKSVSQSHIDILLELLLIEKEHSTRQLILEKLSMFFSRYLEKVDIAENFRIYDCFFRTGINLGLEDFAILLNMSSVCEQVVQELNDGEKRWHEPLLYLARKRPKLFARALGNLTLNKAVLISPEKITNFLKLCENEIIEWFCFNVNETTEIAALSQVVLFMKRWKAPVLIQLIKKLLNLVCDDDYQILLEKLGEIGDVRAAGLLCIQLGEKDGEKDGEKRKIIIEMLGKCKEKLAEQTLLNLLKEPLDINDQILVLSSIEEIGTELSLHTLRKLAGPWSFSFLKNKRCVKEKASQVLKSVKKRLHNR